MENEDSKVWLITGCSSGLGRALTEKALDQGERVIATTRRPEILANLHEKFPRTCLPMHLDLSDQDDMEKVLDQATRLWGRVDVLVNNAGYGLLGPLEVLPSEEIENLFRINFFAPVRLVQKVLPMMRAQKSGHIIMISAAAAIANYPGFSAYGASKAALEYVGEALAQEARDFGIKVSLVQPGPFRTAFISSSLVQIPNDTPAYAGSVGKFAKMLQRIDGRQPGDPSRAANVILNLAKEENPPLRLALGQYAIEKTEKSLTGRLRELESWKQYGLAADFI